MVGAAADRRRPLLVPTDERPLVMGILNVTPDSFSDGGAFERPDVAIAQGLRMAQAGADLIDIGGESTRPGFVPVAATEEMERVLPVVAALAEALGVPISIDTTKAVVARAALAHGATIVNDIWGLQGDPDMAEVVAAAGAGLVMMHNRRTIDGQLDIAADIAAFFERSLALAERAGIARDRLVLDPGVGFGKTPSQQLAAIACIPRLIAHFGLPVLVGVSRKSFLKSMTGSAPGHRLADTIAANLAARTLGARLFRVHDVAEHVAALTVFGTLRGEGLR